MGPLGLLQLRGDNFFFHSISVTASHCKVRVCELPGCPGNSPCAPTPLETEILKVILNGAEFFRLSFLLPRQNSALWPNFCLYSPMAPAANEKVLRDFFL